MGAESFVSLQVVDFAEAVDDRVASLLVAGSGISIAYNDGAGTLTIASTVSPAWGSIVGTLSSQTDLQAALNAKIGGSTGSTDNRILRADGTGGATVQNSAVTIDDSGNISGLGSITCSGTIQGTGSATLTLVSQGIRSSRGFEAAASDLFYWTSRSVLTSPSDGVIQFRNFNGTDYNRLQLGGSTSSFPALKRNGASLEARLADDSGAAGFICGAIVSSALVTVGTYTVATLPSAAANIGALAQVTDSSVTTNGSAVSGGGSNRVVVFSNGSTWDVVVA